MLENLKLDKLSQDIAIDLGTSTVLVYVKGKGIVLNEPALVAVDTSADRVMCVGQEARNMLGRTPPHIKVVRPLRNGSVSQYEVTMQMLQYFIRRACGKVWIPPRVLISVPAGVNDVETRAITTAAREAGARRVYLVEEPLAAAIGAGLDIRSPMGNMVVNIGGGITNVAVMSMGGVVVSDSIRVGGDRFDEAIASYVRSRYGILISETIAENIKKGIGKVYDHREARYMEVCGRSLAQGAPRKVTLSSKEMLEALYEPMTAILDSICTVIEDTNPALVENILRHGMVLTGGGSQLGGLSHLIHYVTKVPARVAEFPSTGIVNGAGQLLEALGHRPEGMIDLRARPDKSGRRRI